MFTVSDIKLMHRATAGMFNAFSLSISSPGSAKRDRKEKERETNHQEVIEMKCPNVKERKK